jgi:hypothetical protein
MRGSKTGVTRGAQRWSPEPFIFRCRLLICAVERTCARCCVLSVRVGRALATAVSSAGLPGVCCVGARTITPCFEVRRRSCWKVLCMILRFRESVGEITYAIMQAKRR